MDYSEVKDDQFGVWDDPLSLVSALARPERCPPVAADRAGVRDGGLSVQLWTRLRLKEPFSGLSHLTGVALSVAAAILLLTAARGRPLHLVVFALYGFSLVALYSASTLYHSLRVTPESVGRLQRLDHMAIFCLIAGTYAPICLLTLQGAWGWTLFIVEYSMALGGITAIIWLRQRFPEWLRVGICAIMTWLIAVAVVPLRAALPTAALGWLLGGLLAYSAGTLILATDWPHLSRGRFSAHDLWHLFVLAGSGCHFMLMLRYVSTAA